MVVSTGTAALRGRASSSLPEAGEVRCRCGHDHDLHQHFRAGTDCSVCGLAGCGRFVGQRGSLLSLRTRLGW
jgi:hypothetical protein